jgi:hypothetical protein
MEMSSHNHITSYAYYTCNEKGQTSYTQTYHNLHFTMGRAIQNSWQISLPFQFIVFESIPLTPFINIGFGFHPEKCANTHNINE